MLTGTLLAMALVQAAAPAPMSTPVPTPLPTPRPAPTGDAGDVIVVATKLRRIRVRYDAVGRTLYSCHAERSSGDREIDRLACRVVAGCVHRGFTEPDRALACFHHVQDRLDEEAAAEDRDRHRAP